MRRFALAFMIAAAPVAADVKGPDGKMRDCYCTDSKGKRVEIGQRICLRVDGRTYLAECQMSLNVPMWREVPGNCAGNLS